jgi:hypothetical protein
MRRFIALILLMVTALSVRAFATEPSSLSTKPFVPTVNYVSTNVAGWNVRVNKELFADQASLCNNALHLLNAKLEEIKRTIPTNACAKLQQVPIWLGVDDGHAPCSEYHPSREWLKEHGFNPDKARCVEIGNAHKFIDWSRVQPSMVLHELAHAYHHQVLGYEYAPIRKAYAHAVSSGIYESVKYANGKMRRAYGLNNEQEYFAETTEAFFGRNDFYPFTREELAKHDPLMYSILQEAWNR